MLSDYCELQRGNLKIRANWNEAVTPAEKFEFTIDGKVAYLDRDDLYSLLMLFGNEEQQELLTPVAETRVKEITRLLKVKAKKDMKKGETLVFPYTYYIPIGTYEKLQIAKGASIQNNQSEARLSAHVNKQKA